MEIASAFDVVKTVLDLGIKLYDRLKLAGPEATALLRTYK